MVQDGVAPSLIVAEALDEMEMDTVSLGVPMGVTDDTGVPVWVPV